ncbi:MAG: DUF448 domain-containing protein [Propionibacteriaceae bacterium]|nr:DUF448 domain-containing protein [Propionibacteriaceae bacterium]
MPIRTCVGCRVSADQSGLVRVVAAPDGFAISRTAPGRGAWLHPGCGALALRRRALPRALRVPAGEPQGLAALTAEVDALASGLGKVGSEGLD